MTARAAVFPICAGLGREFVRQATAELLTILSCTRDTLNRAVCVGSQSCHQ
jgi:hypothetical protein